MSRKHCRRRRIIPVPPRGLRPSLSHDQVMDLQLAHVINLDAIAHGTAEDSMIWDYIGQVLTWYRAAELLKRDTAEMHTQLQVATRLVERFGRTGRVLFDGPDYQLAKQGLQVMDELARTVDELTAIAACEWAKAQCDRMAAMVKAERAQLLAAQAQPAAATHQQEHAL